MVLRPGKWDTVGKHWLSLTLPGRHQPWGFKAGGGGKWWLLHMNVAIVESGKCSARLYALGTKTCSQHRAIAAIRYAALLGAPKVGIRTLCGINSRLFVKAHPYPKSCSQLVCLLSSGCPAPPAPGTTSYLCFSAEISSPTLCKPQAWSCS